MNVIQRAYKTLGLPSGTPLEEIRDRYNLLVKSRHHTTDGDETAATTEDLTTLKVARDILKDHFECGSHKAIGPCECRGRGYRIEGIKAYATSREAPQKDKDELNCIDTEAAKERRLEALQEITERKECAQIDGIAVSPWEAMAVLAMDFTGSSRLLMPMAELIAIARDVRSRLIKEVYTSDRLQKLSEIVNTDQPSEIAGVLVQPTAARDFLTFYASRTNECERQRLLVLPLEPILCDLEGRLEGDNPVSDFWLDFKQAIPVMGIIRSACEADPEYLQAGSNQVLAQEPALDSPSSQANSSALFTVAGLCLVLTLIAWQPWILVLLIAVGIAHAVKGRQ